MKYDFTIMPDRRNLASMKWDMMLSQEPNVPDGIIPLGMADMEFNNPPEIMEGLKEYLDKTVLGYTYPNEDYKNAVQNWMKRRHNFDVKHEWILNTTGVVSALYAGVRSFSKKGDGVVIMPPAYPPFFLSAQMNDRKLLECPLLCTDGYYEIDFDHFESILKTGEAKILIFCSPHNPIGRVWKKEELEKIADLCLKYKVFMLVDEIHHDLALPGYKHTVMQTLSDEVANNCITCTSLSKTFNIAGTSLSTIFVKNEKVREVFEEEILRSAWHVTSNLSFKANEIAYNNCEPWLEEILPLMDKHQRLVHDWAKHTKIKAHLIEGTYLQWLDFRDYGMSEEEMVQFLNKKALFFTQKGSDFGKEGSGFQRLNIALPTKYLQEALDRLDEALKTLN